MSSSPIMDAVNQVTNEAYALGKKDQARETLYKVLTLQVNAHNEKLTAEDYRDVAKGILDDLVAELEALTLKPL